MKTFAGLIVCFILVAGCAKPLQPEYRGIDNLQISKITGRESLISADVKFYNPNKFPLQLKNADILLSLNDKQAAHYLLDSTINIPALDSFYVPAKFEINLNTVFNNMLQLLLTNKTKVNAEGFLKLKKSGFSFNVPLHYESYQNLDSLLQNMR